MWEATNVKPSSGKLSLFALLLPRSADNAHYGESDLRMREPTSLGCAPLCSNPGFLSHIGSTGHGPALVLLVSTGPEARKEHAGHPHCCSHAGQEGWAAAVATVPSRPILFGTRGTRCAGCPPSFAGLSPWVGAPRRGGCSAAQFFLQTLGPL